VHQAAAKRPIAVSTIDQMMEAMKQSGELRELGAAFQISAASAEIDRIAKLIPRQLEASQRQVQRSLYPLPFF
jgi:hypothetical protein